MNNDRLLKKVCKKILATYQDEERYLCIKDEKNILHEHIFISKNYDIIKIRKQVLDLINKKLGIVSRDPKTIASLLILSERKINVETFLTK